MKNYKETVQCCLLPVGSLLMNYQLLTGHNNKMKAEQENFVTSYNKLCDIIL